MHMGNENLHCTKQDGDKEVTQEAMFADLILDRKFRAATEVLEQFVSCSARQITTAELARYTDRSTREVAGICRQLERAGLVQATGTGGRSWTLVCDPSTLTLEDVYRAMSKSDIALSISSLSTSENLSRSVDLLISQATMAVNQSIAQHLRQFSLNRPRTAQVLCARR